MFIPNPILVGVFVIIILLFIVRRNRDSDSGKRYPPSIPSLPLLGSIPFFTGSLEKLHIFFLGRAEQLGPVIRFYAARRLAVSLNGKEAIVEALHKHADAFADRPDSWTEANIMNSNSRGTGIMFAHYSDTSKYYRKLTLSILKEFGFGISREMDVRISQEIEGLVTEIRNQNSCPFDPKSALMYATSNVVMSILFGSESQAGVKYNKLIGDSFEFVRNFDARLEYAPLIRFLPFFRQKITDLSNAHKRLMDQIEAIIEQNKRNPSGRNFVTRFIEIEGSNYRQPELLCILRDLGSGSAHTVEATIMWALLELANNAKIRSRPQGEIDEVCSAGNRPPTIDDKPRLPYTEAVICEVMRRHTITFNLFPRLAMKDTEICGYFIPRGCLAIANMYSVHMDPRVWRDPETFRPERFLDKDNNVVRRDDIFSFGLGRRSCIGEQLARQEVFLFLANLVQNFDIQPPEGQDFVSAKDVQGLIVSPSPFKVRLIPRIQP